jgi:protein-S-isoprenylcysteine O-methyltransferase Ste14
MTFPTLYLDPLFWALLSLLGILAASLVVNDHPLGRRPWFAAIVLVFVTGARLILPLCPQPRFDIGPAAWIGAVLILLLALAIGAPAMTIRWWRPPAPAMKLRTTGVYAIVRHPIYLAELLWPIGWGMIWSSPYAVALTPLWWLAFPHPRPHRRGPARTSARSRVQGLQEEGARAHPSGNADLTGTGWYEW